MNVTLPPVTQRFNQAIGEYGQDYAVPVGTAIYAPVAGIFGTEDKGKQAWGKRAFVHASSGVSFAVGHLTAFAAVPGQAIHAGDLIGYSGGATSDPSSGNTSGPHVEGQWITAAGQYLDPQKIPGIAQLEALMFGQAKTAASAAGGAVTSPGSSGGLGLNPSDPLGLGSLWDSILSWLKRGFWIWLGGGMIVLGLLLLVFDDFERIAKQAAPPIAETVAKNPEVLAA